MSHLQDYDANDYMSDLETERDALKARAEKAEARVKVLEAALRPFVVGNCCDKFVETCSYCVARAALEIAS